MLDPERAWGLDTGYERRLGQRGMFGVNVFYRDIPDLIELTSTGEPAEGGGLVYTPLNVGDGKTWGVELDLSTPLSVFGLDETGVFLNAAWLDSEIEDTILGGDRRFQNQPEYVYNFGFIQNLKDWGAAFGANYRKQDAAVDRVGETATPPMAPTWRCSSKSASARRGWRASMRRISSTWRRRKSSRATTATARRQLSTPCATMTSMRSRSSTRPPGPCCSSCCAQTSEVEVAPMRRTFGGIAVLLLVFATVEAAPRSAVFLHPDGMGANTWGAVRLREVGPDRRLAWDRLPAVAVYVGPLLDGVTASSNGGATTHAWGVRAASDSYGMIAGQPITRSAAGTDGTVMQDAQRAGKAIGLVNSSSITEPGNGAIPRKSR